MEKLPALSEVPLSDWPAPAAALWEEWGIDRAVMFQVPLTVRFRGVTQRSGLLLHGKAGWGECAPFAEYEPAEAAVWLRSALVSATSRAPAARRDRVPVNVTIPVLAPDDAAARAVAAGCHTAKVKVADPRVTLADDVARVRAVAEALRDQHGTAARVRADANAAWTVPQALDALEQLNDAASPVGGLQYVEQPCPSVPELAAVRAAGIAPVAADESIRRAADPFRVVEAAAADVAVVKVAPLGGLRAAADLADRLGIPVVVSSALDSSIGLAAGVQFAAALPQLEYACGLDTGRLLGADVAARKLESVQGFMRVSDAAAVSAGELTERRTPVPREVQAQWLARTAAMALALAQGLQ